MNLREQIEKEITEKVMTKLASEKIELSLLDDFRKEASNATKDYVKANELWVDVEVAKQKAGKQIDTSVKGFKKAQVSFDKLRKSAAQLGLDLPNDIQKIGDFSNQLSNLKDFANDVK